jgi:hypothetical protein
MLNLTKYSVCLFFLAGAPCLGASAVAITGIPVTATFLDTNHEGHIDRIDLTWTDTAVLRQDLPSAGHWIQTLNMTSLDGAVITLYADTMVADPADKTIHVILTQNNGNKYETGWKSATCALTDSAISLSGRPFTVAGIIDGAAPVIKSICFLPAATADTMRVMFSEPVTPANKPGNANGYFSIVNSNTNTSITDTATVIIIQGSRLLYVYRSGTLTDLYSLKEGSRPLFPLTLCGDVSIVTSSQVIPGSFIPGVTAIPADEQNPNSPEDYGTRIEVSLIHAVQMELFVGNITGTVSIFNKAGGRVYSNVPMVVDPGRVALFVTWNGQNDNGAYVNVGTYQASVTVNDQASLKSQSISMSIGVLEGGLSKTASGCGCGAGTGLAFLPPIGFRIASMVRKRKRKVSNSRRS